MKIKYLLASALCFLFVLMSNETFAQEVTDEENVVSAENQLNDAQLFERKMLENRRNKKINKKLYRSAGKPSKDRKKKTHSNSGLGLVTTRGLPSVSGGMFIK